MISASDALYLEDTLGDDRGWRELEVAPMTMLTLHHADLRAVATHPLSFVAQDRPGTLPTGVTA